MVVELMGRDAGWIALEAGIAGGAHVILIPEIPFTIERVADYVREREHIGKRFTIVVIAEGVKLPPELHQYEQERRKSPRSLTVGMLIGDAIGKAAQKDVRVTVLGHIQRGGQPSPFDRILGTRFGVAAVDLIAHHGYGKMVCLQNSTIRAVDIADAIGVLKMVDADGDLVRAARSIGICFGD
jgi:6-phosphofructokinase 1